MIGSKIVVEMDTPAMECGGHQNQTESQTNVNQDIGTGVNNNEESEDDIIQSSQMLTILHIWELWRGMKEFEFLDFFLIYQASISPYSKSVEIQLIRAGQTSILNLNKKTIENWSLPHS